MCDFKVGDKVYFAWYDEPYTVKSGIITEIKCLGDLIYNAWFIYRSFRRDISH